MKLKLQGRGDENGRKGKELVLLWPLFLAQTFECMLMFYTHTAIRG